jgi:hypothetical protein
MSKMRRAAHTPPGAEWDIRYEVALVGQLAARWTEHYRDEQESPSLYDPGVPLCMDYNQRS